MLDANAVTQRAIQSGAAQKHAEFVRLVEHVRDLQPAVVVEIGTMRGGTLRAWCECAADDALIVSIDLPGGQWGGGYQPHEVRRLRSYVRSQQRLELITGNSHDPEIRAQLEAVLDGHQIDFLFIDGDHSYPGVTADFEDYSPYVRTGGWVAFHDIIEHTREPTTQVSFLWDEIHDRYETVEFRVDGDERTWGPWGGIGLLKWPGELR